MVRGARRRGGREIFRVHGGAKHGGGGGEVPAGFDREFDELVVAEGSGSALEEEESRVSAGGTPTQMERTIANFGFGCCLPSLVGL